MKTKAIIFDIDGTVIDSPKQKLPSQRAVDSLRKAENNFYLCAATGRVWTFGEKILKGLGLVDPCIISSGTQICDPGSGKILWQSNLEPEDLHSALEIMKKYPQQKVIFNEYTEDDYFYGGTPPAELDFQEPVYILEQAFVPKELALQIVGELSAIEGIACTMVVAQRPGFNDIHVTNRNATKEHAVAELLKILKLDAKDTIGIGDGHNDIHLFNAVGYKVAMGNAVTELIARADRTIGTVQEEGFAAYMEELSSGSRH